MSGPALSSPGTSGSRSVSARVQPVSPVFLSISQFQDFLQKNHRNKACQFNPESRQNIFFKVGLSRDNLTSQSQLSPTDSPPQGHRQDPLIGQIGHSGGRCQQRPLRHQADLPQALSPQEEEEGGQEKGYGNASGQGRQDVEKEIEHD